MCNCQTWERISDQGTYDGKYPPPEHHPDCEDYKTERFVRVIYDGRGCTMEPDDAADMIADGDVEYQTEDVFITREQFEKMPEFDGF